MRADYEFIVSGGERHQYAVLADITDIKAAEDKITFLAYHDPLTGLGNRVLFQESIQSEMMGLGDTGGFALILLDLDRFKQVNDSYGHHVGDLLLKHVAKRLTEHCPADSTIARLGGDEFAIVARDLTTDGQISEMIMRLFEVFKTPFCHEDKVFHFSFSIGVCFCPEQGTDADELLQYADIAMYKAKKQGRNQFVVYHEAFLAQQSDLYHKSIFRQGKLSGRRR